MKCIVKRSTFYLLLVVTLLLLYTSSSRVFAQTNQTYYIGLNGSDANNGLSQSAAWRTFSHAWTQLDPGDTLLILNGTYTEQINPVYAEGTAGAPITIKALNDGQVTIDGQSSRVPVSLTHWSGDEYFVIEGIIARNSSMNVFDILGDNNTLRRVSGYDANPDSNSFVFALLGDNTILEDCVAAGTGRKMIMSHKGDNNRIRRCLADWERWDGKDWHDPWPWGDGIEVYYGNDNIIENVISIGALSGYAVGLRAPSNANSIINNKVLGSMAIQAGMNEDGTLKTWGCPQKAEPCDPSERPQPSISDLIQNFDNPGFRAGLRMYGQGQLSNNLFQDNLAWGNAGLGFHYNPSPAGMHPSTGGNQLNRLTLVGNGIDQPCQVEPSCPGGGLNTDILSEDMNSQGVSSSSNNCIGNIFNGMNGNGTQNFTSQDGAGARLKYRYVNGVYMDGNNGQPAQELWPWPMEARIQQELGLSITNKMMAVFEDVAQVCPHPAGESTDPIPTPQPTNTPQPTPQPTSTPQPTPTSSVPTPTPTPLVCNGSAEIVSWSTESQGREYSTTLAQTGSLIHTDRDYSITSMTSELANGQLIQTANDDKRLTISDHIFLNICEDAMVYVFYDHRASVLPDWLQTWSATSEELITTDGLGSPLLGYQHFFEANSQVILGGNKQGDASGALTGYTVVVKPTNNSTPTSVTMGPKATSKLFVLWPPLQIFFIISFSAASITVWRKERR